MTVAVTQSPNAGGPGVNSFPGDVDVGGNVKVVGDVNATTLTLNGTPIGSAIAVAGAKHSININTAHPVAAWKDVNADSPGSSILGITDTEGAPLLGNAASGNTKADSALFTLALPGWYVAGSAIKVRLRAKTTALSHVSDKVVCTFKILVDGVLGSDLVTTAAQQLTTSYADYDLTVTPTGLVAGDVVHVTPTVTLIDTGGTTGGVGSISAVSLLLG